MTKNSQKRAQILARRRQVAKLVMSKLHQTEIAEKLGVTQATISNDVRALKKEWQEEAARDTHEFRSQELAELQDMEKDAAIQYVNTKDHRWHELRLKLKVRIAKMLGIDEPERVDHTSGNEPIAIVNIDIERLMKPEGGEGE